MMSMKGGGQVAESRGNTGTGKKLYASAFKEKRSRINM